jgi:hypothetical protein
MGGSGDFDDVSYRRLSGVTGIRPWLHQCATAPPSPSPPSEPYNMAPLSHQSTMDEKTPLLPRTYSHEGDINGDAAAALASREKRTSRIQMAALVILFAIFWLAQGWTSDPEQNEMDTKVSLDVHIM